MLNKKLQKNFTIADNRIMQLQGLSFEARGLYFYMLSLPDDWEFSEVRLAKNGGIGIDKCKRILKELFCIGLLKREFIHNEKGHKKSVYTLYDFSTLEKPTLENPTLENPMNNKEINNNKELNLNKEIYIQKEKNTKKEKDEAQKYFCPKGQSVFSHALENDFSESENISLFKPETSQKSILELEAIQRELERLKIENKALKSQISENTKNHTEEKESELKDEFSQIWNLYPNKQGKQVALQSYINARKGIKKRGITIPPATFETILRGVKHYLTTQRGVEIRFIKHLSTFLNQATYLDFQGEVNLNRRVGVIDDHEDYLNADKSIYIPK